MMDVKIYVDGIATMRFQDSNGMPELTRAEFFFCHVMCESLKTKYDKLSVKERSDFMKVMKKSGYFKDSSLCNRKRR